MTSPDVASTRLPASRGSCILRRVFRALVLAVAMLAVSALASVACAQDAAPSTFDTVELANGGVLRGTLIVYEPGQTVVLQLPTGEVREIAPAEVAAVRRGSTAPTPPPPATSGEGRGTALGQAVIEPEPEPTPEPERTSEPVAASGPPELVSAPVASGGTWELASPSSEAAFRSSSWRDVSGRHRPRGDVHLGVQGGVGLDFPLLHCDSSSRFRCRQEVGALLEVGGFVDLRPNSLSFYRFRAAVVFGLHQTDTGVGLLSGQVRLGLLGFDLGDWLVWRIGLDLGVRWYDRTTYVGHDGRLYNAYDGAAFSVGPTTTLALTLLERSLEVGVRLGGAFTFGAGGMGGAGAFLESVLHVAYLF